MNDNQTRQIAVTNIGAILKILDATKMLTEQSADDMEKAIIAQAEEKLRLARLLLTKG